MKTIAEIQSELRKLCQELEALKQEQEAKAKEVDLKKICAVASRYPIENHPMLNEDEHHKDMYLQILFSVAVLEKQNNEDGIKTICRIAYGMGYTGDFESLLIKAQTMNFDILDECTRLFGKSELKYILLLECMLVTAEFDGGKRRALEYISELAVLLNITKEDIVFLANLARVILTQDLNEYTIDMQTNTSLYDCYLVNFLNKFDIQLIEVPYMLKKQDFVFPLINFSIDEKLTFSYSLPQFDHPQLRLFVRMFGSNNMQQTSTVDLEGEILDFHLKKIPKLDNYDYSNYTKLEFIFGVTSKHPLAHSMAIQAYKQRVNEWLEELDSKFDKQYGVTKAYVDAGGIIE